MRELDQGPARELPFELVNGDETAEAHVRNALQVLELLAGDRALEEMPTAARLSLTQVLTSITRRLQATVALLRLGDRRVAVLSALLDAGGLEFVPRGTTARDRALLVRAREQFDRMTPASGRTVAVETLTAELAGVLAETPSGFLDGAPS